MARRRFVLGGREFGSAVELKSHVRAIAARSDVGAALCGSDSAVLRDLVKLHPWADEKIGAGVKSLEFRSGIGASKALYIVRVDGSETDISWLKCIDGHNQRGAVSDAFRKAVLDQILDFLGHVFRTGARCELSGEVLSRGNVHVDHIIPFADLVSSFLASVGQTYDTIQTVSAEDGRGIDLEFPQAWREYHRAHAHLRAVSADAHRKYHRGQA